MDFTYKRMRDDTEAPPFEGDSDVRRFFDGETVLVSAASDLLGKCLAEKLLRSCPGLKRLYLLLDAKDTAQRRSDAFWESAIFDDMRGQCDLAKVRFLEADLTKPGLGMSAADRGLVAEDASVVIHNGAGFEFGQETRDVLTRNVRGTRAMLELAGECKRLKVFMYASGVYAQCPRGDVAEEFYDAPSDSKMVDDMLKSDAETAGLTEEAVDGWLGDWPNLQTFLQATAEGLVENYGKRAGFACGVFRPGILLSTFREPLRGWSDNVCHSPQAAFLGVSLGLVHAVYSKDRPIDLVPVDMAVNGLLAATWDLAVDKKDRGKFAYNYGTSDVNPVTLRRFNDGTLAERNETPSSKMLWYHTVFFTKCWWMFYALHLLTHFLPALLADVYLMARGCRTRALPIYCRITKRLSRIDRFVNADCRANVTESQKLWDRMNPVDRELFFCDLRCLDWDDYFRVYWSGFRRYVLKETADTLPAARRKLHKLRILNGIVIGAFLLLLSYLVLRSSNRCPVIGGFL